MTLPQVRLFLIDDMMVALAMEGKFASEGPQAIDGEETAMARKDSGSL